jgi:hypothetical protein
MTTTSATVTVVSLLTEVDLRSVHKLRLEVMASLGKVRLQQHTAVLAMNRACTRARLLTRNGVVVNFYAAKGEIFDIATIQRRVDGLRFVLALSPEATKVAIKAELVNPTPKATKVKKAA